ncbi:MAG: 16S rRNA (cytosine(967)-C(5))-methyltransferase RsmB [Gammaproteobacteria bacterium]|nr:16S rRNA (cytosine(967)-C(5))-methyltransferase RsmB [Gammaproteobacteria bacterium]
MSTRASAAEIRASAATLVSQTIDRGRSLDELLAGDPDEGSARGLKRSLCYGTLRWHFRLIEILRRLCERPVERLEPGLRALLEVGLFQLLSGEVAPHAAVAETVGAARVLGFERAAGFVNAVLRRFQREREALLAAVDADLSVRTAHPRWFVEALERDRPQLATAILEAGNAHPPMWLRVNRLRADPAGYAARLESEGWQVKQHAFAPDALLIDPPTDVRSLPGFAEGQVSVQDAAAQLAVELLAPQPGERILDACAAPGGKTCHILERVAGRAEVVALDVSEGRLERVRENLARLGLAALVQAGDVSHPAQWWDGRPFDRILLDVPCSATGVIRRHPDIKVLRRASDIPALARRQAAMLESAWGLLRPGGVLLYTSCSVLRAEDEGVVGAFLARTADARDRTPERTAGWPERSPGAGPGYLVQSGEADMDGFYYACLGKHP